MLFNSYFVSKMEQSSEVFCACASGNDPAIISDHSGATRHDMPEIAVSRDATVLATGARSFLM
jgi:hypothetical protein